MPSKSAVTGLAFERYFTKSLQPNQDVAEMFTWTRRHVVVKDGSSVVYEADVEAPDFWSDLAVTVAAKTWFRRIGGVIESSIKDMIRRVVDAIAEASRYPDVGTDYFGGDEAKRVAFRDELFYICAAQYAMFNTPVWVNVGVATAKHASEAGKALINSGKRRKSLALTGVYGSVAPNVGPQASACFIQGVEDTMESLCVLQTSETMLFRNGSGTGTNMSPLRPANSPLSCGGTASGPVSFMRGPDAWAGVTKSGGKSRRAAKMINLDVYHPDIDAFIKTKSTAQKMIRDLGAGGWDVGFNGVATTWTPYQNANNSVRVDDAFMEAATTGQKIKLHWPTQWGLNVGGDVTEAVHGVKAWGPSVDASSLLHDIAVAAHDCGDPGVMFDTIINRWHTTKSTARINACNPCAEFNYMDDTACNLASLRLTKFLKPSGDFDVDAFSHTARTVFIGQEVLVGAASYPTEKIAKNSHDFRPLGLGYCDLGALLMQLALPYDSDDGRGVCAAVTSLLGAVAYRTSAEIARDCGGAFPGFAVNRDSMLDVIGMHVAAAKSVKDSGWSHVIAEVAYLKWQAAQGIGEVVGYRNAQSTVLAPTGTIGFALDCDTTGIEPDTALVKSKKLAGGGTLEYVNQSIAPALRHSGYTDTQIENIVAHLKKTGELPVAYEGHASGGNRWLRPQHRTVFATAFGQPDNEISVDGHLEMMAAAQPFLSGAISKTVNCPAHYTVEQIKDVFIKAWKLGLKAVAIYRDGSKDQPLSAKTSQPSLTKLPLPKDGDPVTVESAIAVAEEGARRAFDAKLEKLLGDVAAAPAIAPSMRRRLPVDAAAHRHKFSLGGVDGYIHLGFFDAAKTELGEIFVRMAPNAENDCSVVVDLATQAASVAIQHGASVEGFIEKWEKTKFAPSGFTGEGPDGVGWASSPLDYLAKWLRNFMASRAEKPQEALDAALSSAAKPEPTPTATSRPGASQPCPRCTSTMRRDGACLSCPTCGFGQGGCGG